MPPPNDQRRAELADAAIALLAETGVHGVTHRTVERRAGLPPGTASNYHRSREALLIAAAERITDLHRADMDAAARAVTASPARTRDTVEQAIDLIADSLLEAATIHRARYLAIFELHLESLRRPALATALAALFQTAIGFTTAHHAELKLDIPPAAVPTLITLYGGALYTLVTAPQNTVTRATTHTIAASIVRGALSVDT